MAERVIFWVPANRVAANSRCAAVKLSGNWSEKGTMRKLVSGQGRAAKPMAGTVENTSQPNNSRIERRARIAHPREWIHSPISGVFILVF